MKKWIIPMVALTLMTSFTAHATDQRDAAPLDDARFEGNPKPAVIPNILPDMGILTIGRDANNETKVLLEAGYKQYSSDQVGVPMQLEVTSNNGQMDISKARVAAWRIIDGMCWNCDGYKYTLDWAELDHTKTQVGDQTMTQSSINIVRFVPVLAFKLDSGENVVLRLKGDAAVGWSKMLSERAAYANQSASSFTAQLGASAGVVLAKRISLDSYYNRVNSGDLTETTNGVRAKVALPDSGHLKNNSLQMYRQCDKLTGGDQSSKNCVNGGSVSVGF
jgi:hypothetical protein